jgi:nicotinate-nucleotide pyrophosphorylase (carboxylating)
LPRRIIDFPKRLLSLPQELVNRTVLSAIEEDLGKEGDLTSMSVLSDLRVPVWSHVISREDGIICGIDIFTSVYRAIDPALEISALKKDGDSIKKGETIIEMRGNASSITSGERTALNFLGILSGISTNVHSLAEKITNYPVRILDTRKTLPNLRLFQKYAVAVGGGFNHRIGLFDMILIKDNHIMAAGGIRGAVKKARRAYPALIIETEVRNMAEAREALETEADIIMLDNMDNSSVKKAVSVLKDEKYIEASGNVNDSLLIELAGTGVDFISMGSLTHTISPLDLSLLII